MTHRPALDAQDVMIAEPVCVLPSTTIRELARTFEDHAISGAPVVNSGGSLIGVVSKTDLIRRCTEAAGDMPPAYLFELLFDQGDGGDTPHVLPEPLVCVEDFMTDDPVVVSRCTPATAVADLMFTRRIHRVIVVDGANVPVGIITSLDLLGVLPRVIKDLAQSQRPSSDHLALGPRVVDHPVESKTA